MTLDSPTPHDRPRGAILWDVPDPFLLIVGCIALLCVVLFPVRMWRRRNRRYEDDEGT